MGCVYDCDYSWIINKDKDFFKREEFIRITNFFVYNTPCKTLSARSIELKEYGWSNPWKKPYSLRVQLCNASTNKNLIYSTNRYAFMEETLIKSNLLDRFPCNLDSERICIYDKMSNQTLSVFYHLRNALAHGRYDVRDVDEEKVYIFQDVNLTKKKYKVSARMIIKEKTLLRWIEIIELGEEIYKNK